ncbi:MULTISPECIES: hypothetical protein [Streptomyces]|uniref:Uncharacterized protein n=1 Tax=Streptomyces alboflavus TaxID=67267 RepID=A0A1Z1WSG5_9ACTN|nr:hypothetical protein [Streptomyces alboflavus]ARX89375.1 hypothetical protein SMD44_08862 [Streptomyces alboflavus]
MKLILRRVIAVIVLLSGASLGLWTVAGSPQDWTGGMWWVRFLMGMGGLGLVVASARLMYPDDRRKDQDDDRDPTAASSTMAGPLDDLFQ